MATRQEYNLEICDMLTEFFSQPEHADLRFFQALSIMDTFDYNTIQGCVLDPFSKESKETNNKIYKFLKKKKIDGN
jgi:hypothetical protein